MLQDTPQLIDFAVSDGLTLRGALYGVDAPLVVCLPGLTRNARDFENAAPRIAEMGFSVLALSLRGRGLSDRASDSSSYHPATYRDDVTACLNQMGAEKAIFVGTSLGGITTMLISEQSPGRVQAAIINDVGPELAPEGIARIISYVSTAMAANEVRAATLEDAIEIAKSGNEAAFPGRDQDFWRQFAKRTFRQCADGSWAPDYDPGIARAFETAPAPPDLWVGFKTLEKTPTLLIRGALSDLLTPSIVDEMQRARPGFDYCEIPNTGHAPTLDEPEAQLAIKKFLTPFAR